jgi:serine/threonine protein kinase
MSKISRPVTLQTAFGEYSLDELIGEGGAGRVFGGIDDQGNPIAVKVLTQFSAEKKRRFRNETAFLSTNKHINIVSVVDHGFATEGSVKGPFYVMRRYMGNLREKMQNVDATDVTKHFLQILDGVEAAHILGVTHRDLKPENILFDKETLAIADFGIASFTKDQLATLVETGPAQRLANFQYAAPEQRAKGQQVSQTADIYALGLILNEMFTKRVPHGTDFLTIASVSTVHGYFDPIVSKMIKQNPAERPESILQVKRLIQQHSDTAISLQKLSKLNETVVIASEIDEPLALVPPKLVAVNWVDGTLELTLDRQVSLDWIVAFQNMGSFTSVMGVEPTSFGFNGKVARASVRDHSAQQVVDYFNVWLPKASEVLKHNLEAKAHQEEVRYRQELQHARQREELRNRVNSNLKI